MKVLNGIDYIKPIDIYAIFMLNSLTELYVKFNSKDKLQIDEQPNNNANKDVYLNVKNPSYIDNGPPPYTETARMARYIVHYSGIMIEEI